MSTTKTTVVPLVPKGQSTADTVCVGGCLLVYISSRRLCVTQRLRYKKKRDYLGFEHCCLSTEEDYYSSELQ